MHHREQVFSGKTFEYGILVGGDGGWVGMVDKKRLNRGCIKGVECRTQLVHVDAAHRVF